MTTERGFDFGEQETETVLNLGNKGTVAPQEYSSGLKISLQNLIAYHCSIFCFFISVTHMTGHT